MDRTDSVAPPTGPAQAGAESEAPVPAAAEYAQALGRYVSAGSAETWQLLRGHAVVLARQAGTVSAALGVHWESARQARPGNCLLSGSEFDALLRAERHIVELFEADSSRRSSYQARLAAAIDAAGDAVMIAADGEGIQYVNPAFERLTGRSAAELAGADPEVLGARYANQQAETEACSAIAEGVIWKGFVVHLRKNGESFESDETITPIRDASGQVTGRVHVLRDISERRRMVETMEQAVMVKSEFTNMVSHELRTPLTAIKESILVVADETAGPLNERQDYFLKIAVRNLERLHRLINDTLDFSKIERGEFRIAIKPADLNSLVREIVHQQRLAANKNGLRLEMSLDRAMGDIPIDSDRISQVLVNLIGNAVRYCERGWIEVTTTRVGQEALVKVQDTGPGIPDDKLEFIFDAFAQLSTGDKRRSGGTGLGLAITRQIVEMHGGSIWVESEIGRGSAFYFSLPVEVIEEDARR